MLAFPGARDGSMGSLRHDYLVDATRIRPRMAVAYHFFKDPDTTAGVNDRIRKTYDGPMSLAEDFMVWNITRDEIRTRMAVVEERTWACGPRSTASCGTSTRKPATRSGASSRTPNR